MNRRDAIVALCVLAALARDAAGQKPGRMVRIGYLAGSLTAGVPLAAQALVQGLRDLGYVEGRNLVIEYRDAGGNLERLPAAATELVSLNVDVILAPGTQHVEAARRATRTIPIVFADVGDPVASGFVESLAHPGGNITGLTNLNPELIGKWLEIIKEALPRARRVGFLWQPGIVAESYESSFLQRADIAAQALGLSLQRFPARTAGELDQAFSDMARARVDAILVWAGVMFIHQRAHITELAARNHLPGIYPMGQFVDEGGLMSYTPNIPDNFRRAAGYIDKIIKGAKPADLPIEQSNRFELVVNRQVANALGIEIPRALLQRADRVIE